jgi:hypothetical protein
MLAAARKPIVTGGEDALRRRERSEESGDFDVLANFGNPFISRSRAEF